MKARATLRGFTVAMRLRIWQTATVALLVAIWATGWCEPRHSVLARSGNTGESLSPAYRGLPAGEYVRNADHLWLHVRTWLPSGSPSPRAVLVVSHGLNLHSAWYAALAGSLTQLGVAVVAHDHQGWGLSEGDRGYSHSFSSLAADFALVARRSRGALKTSEVYCLGVSMGAVAVAEALESDPGLCTGVVFVGAALKTKLPPAPVLAALHVVSAVLPKLPVAWRVHDTMRDLGSSEIARQVAADKLVHWAPVRARFADTFIHSQSRVSESAASIAVPMLVLHGTADETADIGAVRRLCTHLGTSERKCIEYRGAGHGLLNSPSCSERTMRDIAEWVSALLAKGR